MSAHLKAASWGGRFRLEVGMFAKHYVWTAQRRRKDGEFVYVSGSFMMPRSSWAHEIHRKAEEEAVIKTNPYEAGRGWSDRRPVLLSVSRV